MQQQYTVIVTSYECHGLGCQFLQQNLDSLLQQSYRPLQIVISDHSRDDKIEKLVIEKYESVAKRAGIDLVYVRYSDNYGDPCANWNNGAQYATGDFRHYFALDDYFENPDAIADVVKFANAHDDAQWFACAHKTDPDQTIFIPRWNDSILQHNTLSGPSAVVLRAPNLHSVPFDSTFLWFLDLDWYYRLFLESGRVAPSIIEKPIWCNRHHAKQLTNTICCEEQRQKELLALKRKYGDPLPSNRETDTSTVLPTHQ